MCSTSKVTEALKGVSMMSSSSREQQASIVPSISANRVRQHRKDFFMVDVREASEVEQEPFDEADINVPLGSIIRDASGLLASCADKTLVCVCKTSKRSEMAAQEILEQNVSAKVAVLQKGFVGWENMAAVTPDFLVVLGLGGADSTEKLSLALAAVATAVDSHDTVVLVLMSDGVNWFLKPDSPKLTEAKTPHVETVEHGAPFKPCKAMLNKFLSNGGVVLACTTCFKHRGYSLENDMMDCVHPMQMPDLIRMLGEAKGGSLQFM